MNRRALGRRAPEKTNCQTGRTPSLADRFQQLFSEHITLKTEKISKKIVGYSVPLRLLRMFSSISCLNCYLCQNGDEYDPPEGVPIIAWSMDYIAIMMDGHDDGTKICVVGESWWASKRGHAPNIEDVGKTFILK